jgi:hypothetical protein
MNVVAVEDPQGFGQAGEGINEGLKVRRVHTPNYYSTNPFLVRRALF